MSNSQFLAEVFKNKFSRASAFECTAAIKDCHETLVVGQYPYESEYAQKLWAEIDAARERQMTLSRSH